MDDNLVVFGENSIQVFAGEGLNDTGAFNTLSEPRTVATDVGAIANSPRAKFEQGILFKSAKGFTLLSRSLQVDDHVGWPVEDYNSLTLSSAVVVPGKRQVRFGHSDGDVLAYDYGVGKWSLLIAPDQVSATFWNDLYCLLQSSGVVWKQSTGFVDDAAAISLVAETPWIKLASVQGFQRLYRCSVLGTWKSAHTLTLKVYYDYNDTVAETVTWDLSSGYSAEDPLQVRHHLGKACEAVKFRLEDSAQAGTKESASWAGVSLEIGGKGGVFRQSASNTA
jgi:hypothetical protein